MANFKKIILWPRQTNILASLFRTEVPLSISGTSKSSLTATKRYLFCPYVEKSSNLRGMLCFHTRVTTPY